MNKKNSRIPDTYTTFRYDGGLLSSRKVTVIIATGIILICLCSIGFAWAVGKNLIPSYGEGKRELIVFTDYFCAPCQLLEVDIESLLKSMLAAGSIKVTFVDVPIHPFTPLYGKYFLYTANAGGSYEDALHARNTLFALAKTNNIVTEDALVNALRKQHIAFKPYNLKQVYAAMNVMMRKYDIRSTPTCIIKYSDSDVRRYIGANEIKQGLSLLQSRQKK